MSADEKLINKFLADRMHVTEADCDRLLNDFGYTLHKKGGSHRSYHKKGTTPIIIVSPKKSKYVISPYVNRIVKDLGLEEWRR